jgi:hypothetical protein
MSFARSISAGQPGSRDIHTNPAAVDPAKSYDAGYGRIFAFGDGGGRVGLVRRLHKADRHRKAAGQGDCGHLIVVRRDRTVRRVCSDDAARSWEAGHGVCESGWGSRVGEYEELAECEDLFGYIRLVFI